MSGDNDRFYKKEEHTITDAYGNKISYELQSVKQSVSDENGGNDSSRGYAMLGYMVGAMNITPENSNYEGISRAAKEFIKQHPEFEQYIMKDKQGNYNSTSLDSIYMQWVVSEETLRRYKQGNATTMEKAYAMQMGKDFLHASEEFKKNGYWTAEQLEGKEPLNRDTTNQAVGSNNRESLRSGLKQDANAAANAMSSHPNNEQATNRQPKRTLDNGGQTR